MSFGNFSLNVLIFPGILGRVKRAPEEGKKKKKDKKKNKEPKDPKATKKPKTDKKKKKKDRQTTTTTTLPPTTTGEDRAEQRAKSELERLEPRMNVVDLVSFCCLQQSRQNHPLSHTQTTPILMLVSGTNLGTV